MQIAILMGAGAPILIIMPLLILLPRLYLRVKAIDSVPKERRSALQKFSFYWTERFAFAFVTWLGFIGFQAATPSINAFPSPGTACMATLSGGPEEVISDSDDPKAQCYSEYMAGAHTLAFLVVLAICVLFPLWQWKLCRKVNYLGLEDEVVSESFGNRYGSLYAANGRGWKRYWGLVVYFNTTVLIGTLSLWLAADPNLGLPISCIVVCGAIMLGFIFLFPSAERFDDLVESYFLAVQIISLSLQIVVNDPKQYQMNKEVREALRSNSQLNLIRDRRCHACATPLIVFCRRSGVSLCSSWYSAWLFVDISWCAHSGKWPRPTIAKVGRYSVSHVSP